MRSIALAASSSDFSLRTRPSGSHCDWQWSFDAKARSASNSFLSPCDLFGARSQHPQRISPPTKSCQQELTLCARKQRSYAQEDIGNEGEQQAKSCRHWIGNTGLNTQQEVRKSTWKSCGHDATWQLDCAAAEQKRYQHPTHGRIFSARASPFAILFFAKGGKFFAFLSDFQPFLENALLPEANSD